MTKTYKITDTITNELFIADDLNIGIDAALQDADDEIRVQMAALADAYERGEYVGEYEAYLGLHVEEFDGTIAFDNPRDAANAHILVPHYKVTIEDADEICDETYLCEEFIDEKDARERFDELAKDLGDWGMHDVELWLWECLDAYTQCSVECLSSKEVQAD